MEMELKMDTISDMQSNTTNTVSTLVIHVPTQDIKLKKNNFINNHCKDVCLDFRIACHMR
jgi:hypothetical protein